MTFTRKFINCLQCILQRHSMKKKMILLFCVVLTILLLLILRHSTSGGSNILWNGNMKTMNSMNYNENGGKFVNSSKQNEICETIDIAIVCAGYNASREVVTLIKSMLFHRRYPLHIHFVVDSVAKMILGNLFRTWDISDFTVSFYLSDKLEEKVSWIPNFHYSGVYGLFKLVLLDVIPEYVHRVIVMDVDLMIMSDVMELWRLIGSFNKNQAIGLVENQSDWYLGKLRTDHKPWPAVGQGFNSGLMLLHCDKLRDINWNDIWLKVVKEELATLPGTSLADQDVINAVIAKNQDMVYVLSCYWNVQLSMNTNSEQCYGRNISSIRVLHWNSPQKQKPKLKNKHGPLFKNLYHSFVEYDGALLRNPLSYCTEEKDVQDDHYYVDDDCQDFVFKSFKLHRTHLYYLPFDYVPSDSNDVTLTIHLSIDRLPMLEEICKNWMGPISIAIFLRDSDTNELLQYVNASPALNARKNIGYHIVFRNFDDVSYPINALRNIAWQQAITEYVFLCDVDFLPSKKLYEYLKNSVLATNERDSKVAFVIPAFESLWYRFDFPETKTELLTHWDKGVVTPFRSYMWAAGHSATNYTKWRNFDEPYAINRTKDFEPYVVLSKKLCPPYDKRFFGFGWNKVSHIMELDAAGFRFIVLPFAFVIHMPHMASLDILKYRSSSVYRQCIYDIKLEFINDLVTKYGVDAEKFA